MQTLTITTKGQVTFKKDLLRHLGVSPGKKLEVVKLADGAISVRALRSGDLGKFFGCLHDNTGVSLSIEEMNDAIAKAWAGAR